MYGELQLFPHIRLISSDIPITADENELEICCCVSGVCEYQIANRYYYLTDDTILTFNGFSDKAFQPLCSSDFCGLFLIIDPNCNNEAFSELFGISDVFWANSNNTSVNMSDDRCRDLIEAVLAGTEKSQTSFIRLKILELFVLLSENGKHRKINNKVSQIGDLICQNLSDHYTIGKISEMLSINQTTLKNEFKRTYGCGIYSYAKKRKMFRAAELLIQTDMKIIDIAEEVGYNNASKFAKAFHSVMGTTPKHFQMEHKNS